MTLTLHYHPLASFCWKVLVALYENDTPFERVVVDFGDEESRARFVALWPMAKMPVLVDDVCGAVVPESTTIMDYLDAFHPGTVRFTPSDSKRAWQVRSRDRFFDNYVHQPMQQIVSDALRPEAARDPFGAEQARELVRKSYDYLDREMTGREWAVESFGLADVSAMPALFYANTVEPFGQGQTALRAYHERLMARRSFERVLLEAEPYFALFPREPKPVLPAHLRV